MLYETFLVEKLFTPEQIEVLREVHRKTAVDNLLTLMYLQDKVKELLPDVVFQSPDLDHLCESLYHYFL